MYSDLIEQIDRATRVKQKAQPGDQFFSVYCLDPILSAELDSLKEQEPSITATEIAAFNISNRIPEAILKNDFTLARRMAFYAIKMDPKSFDAYHGFLL
jgi:hypothetical protein